jgi:hypothetical protein
MTEHSRKWAGEGVVLPRSDSSSEYSMKGGNPSRTAGVIKKSLNSPGRDTCR